MFNKFPILAFPAGEFDEKNIEEVALWNEIGLTLNFTNLWDETKHEKSSLLRLLDECEKFGIKMIIQDARLHWKGAASDPEGYLQALNLAPHQNHKNKLDKKTRHLRSNLKYYANYVSLVF